MERKKVETKVGVFLVGRLEYWRSFCPKNSQPQKIKRKNLVAQEGRVWSSIVILDFVRRIKGRTDPIRERQRDFYFIISRLLYKKLFGRKRAKGLFGQFGILLFFLYSLLFFPFFFAYSSPCCRHWFDVLCNLPIWQPGRFTLPQRLDLLCQ